MRIAIAGASGFIGKQLQSYLRKSDHEIVTLVRRTAWKNEVYWNPAAREIESEKVEGLDAVINLCGETIFGRWTKEKKERIYTSRVESTQFLSETLASLDRKPEIFLSASTVAAYGSRGDEILTEESPRGDSYTSQIASDWETATKPASDAGIRVVNLRTGIALHPAGGVLKEMLPILQAGLGGPMGDGSHYVSWIAMDDLLGAMGHLMMSTSLSGPYNLAAPQPVTNAEFTRTLADYLGKPAFMRVPKIALSAMFTAQMAEEVMLASHRVSSKKLTDSGYRFQYEILQDAIEHLLG